MLDPSDEQLDDSYVALLGLGVETMVGLLAVEVEHVQDDSLRDGLVMLVCALEGAVRRDV